MLRLVGILFTVLFAIATAILVWPQFFQLELTFPIAQIVASRAAAAVGLLVVAVLAALLLLARPLRGFAATILIVSLIGAGSPASSQTSRRMSSHCPRPPRRWVSRSRS